MQSSMMLTSANFLFTNNSFCIVQRAKLKTGVNHGYGSLEAPPIFQADWPRRIFFSLSLNGSLFQLFIRNF
jgi:hypothetical protein